MGSNSTTATATHSTRSQLVHIAVVGALVVVAACSNGSGQGEAGRTFETFDGATASLDDYQGQPLVLNFFASWCPPCIREMPAFEEAHQTYGDQVAFLGLAVNDTVEDSTAIVEETGITYDLGRDPRGDLIAELGGIAMPTTVLVAADGTILDVHSGELSAAGLETRITEDLLG